MSIAVTSAATQGVSGQKTLAHLRKYVLNYTGGGDDPDQIQLADDAVNGAIDRLNTRTWQWSYSKFDISLVEDIADYTLPSDFHKPRKLQRRDTSSNPDGSIPYLDPKTFWDCYDRATRSGSPTVYTVGSAHKDGTLTLDLPPNSNFIANYPTMRLVYMAYIRRLTFPSEVLAAPPAFQSYVGWQARGEYADVSGHVGKSDRAYGQAASMLRALVADDNNQITDW